MAEKPSISIVKVGGQRSITVDVLSNNILQPEAKTSKSRLIYTLPKLQDEQKRHYATYEVAIGDLQDFLKTLADDKKIEYIHE